MGLDEQLLHPERLWMRCEVLGRPSAVPDAPGVYAWYFDEVPGIVPVDECHTLGEWAMLYAGISPKEPSRSGGKPSSQTLRTRLRYHFRGNAYGSTLRLTLGSLLASELGIQLRRVGSGTRLTFADGESVLSGWMDQHARVCWVSDPAPWIIETSLIQTRTLPLNLSQNAHSAFRAELSGLRRDQRYLARSLPVVHT